MQALPDQEVLHAPRFGCSLSTEDVAAADHVAPEQSTPAATLESRLLPRVPDQSQPLPVSSVSTSLQESLAGFGIATSAAVRNMPIATPPVPKVTTLRLPSFDLLGIAAPHPDSIYCLRKESLALLTPTGGAASPSHSSDPRHSQAVGRPLQVILGDPAPSVSPYLPLHTHFPATPPDDRGDIDWRSAGGATTAAGMDDTKPTGSTAPQDSALVQLPLCPENNLDSTDSSMPSGVAPWLRDVLPIIRTWTVGLCTVLDC